MPKTAQLDDKHWVCKCGAINRTKSDTCWKCEKAR